MYLNIPYLNSVPLLKKRPAQGLTLILSSLPPVTKHAVPFCFIIVEESTIPLCACHDATQSNDSDQRWKILSYGKGLECQIYLDPSIGRTGVQARAKAAH
jgi:hypothetical protein